MESDEENESSVKDLNLTPSESEDLSDNEIKKHDALSVIDSEKTLDLAEATRQSFADFELGLYREVYEMKAIFQQIKTKVEQCSVDRRYFEIEKKELLIVCTAMHSNDDLVKYAEMEQSYIDEYS
ncbi:hypothetical protein Tco_0589150, partial [Tanacetum coccineum]